MTKPQQIEVLKGRVICLEKRVCELAQICERSTKILKEHDKKLKGEPK